MRSRRPGIFTARHGSEDAERLAFLSVIGRQQFEGSTPSS
jgi:hypothetical protein